MTWQFILGDCIKQMKAMPEVDLVFGSPPYEQARLYLEGGKNLGVARKTTEWVAWMADVQEAAQERCRGLVAFVVAGQTKNYRWSAGPALLIAELHRRGMNLRNPPIFSRIGIPGSGGPDWLRGDYEWIVCTSRPGKLPWSDSTAMGHAPKWAPGGDPSHRMPNGRRVARTRLNTETDGSQRTHGYNPPEKANPGNIVHCNVGGGQMGEGDPFASENEAPFPEKLAEFFIRSFAPPGGRVLDPFSGSGTTVAVAHQLKRQGIGIDIRQSQIDLGTRRCQVVTPDLFEGATP